MYAIRSYYEPPAEQPIPTMGNETPLNWDGSGPGVDFLLDVLFFAVAERARIGLAII